MENFKVSCVASPNIDRIKALMDSSSWKHNVVFKAGLIVVIITFLVYIPALFGDFVNLDDPQFIYTNPAIRELDLQFIRESFTTSYAGWWMPLIWISFAIDYHFWGLNPFGYHLTNNLLHAINSGLVVVVADVLYKRALDKKLLEGGSTGYLLLLVTAGLFFGIHPAHVESVAWAVERKNVLSTVFTLSSLIFYLRYATIQSEQYRRETGYVAYLLSIVFLALSLMTKPVGVVIPVLLLMADFYPFSRINRNTAIRIIAEKIPHGFLAFATAVASVMLATGEKVLVPLSLFPLTDRFILSGYAVFEYCRFLLVPFGIIVLNLFPLPLPLSYSVMALLVASFSIIAVVSVRRRPWIAATWFSFLFSLLPSLHFFINGANRYSLHFLYLPAIIPSITFAAVFFSWHIAAKANHGRRLAPFLYGSLVLLFILFIVLTQVEIRSWNNSGALWTRVIKVQPVGRAYYYRAEFFMDKGDFNAAVADYRESIRMGYEAGHPEIYTLHAFCGEALRKAGRNEEAVKEFTQAIELSPIPNFFYYRSLAQRSLGYNHEADKDLSRSGNEHGPIVWQFLRDRDDLKPRREL